MPDPLAPSADAAAPAPADLAVAPRAVIVRQLEMLGELAELGLDIARAIARQATSETPGAAQVVKGDVSLAYARVARAVRLTLALRSRLLQDLQAWDEVAERHLRGGRLNAARARKARIGRILDRVIDAEAGDDGEGDRLAGEVRERLEHDDIYGDVLARPVGELVAMICRDLGLSPDWVRLAEEAWAQDEIEGGQAGSPFSPPRWRQPNPLGHDAATESDPMAPQAASPQAASP
jgi:hypothetical protein